MPAQLASWNWVMIHHNFNTHNHQNRGFIAEETAFWHLYPWIIICASITGFFLLLLPCFIFHPCCILSIPSTEKWANVMWCWKSQGILFFLKEDLSEQQFVEALVVVLKEELFWKRVLFLKSELVSHLYQSTFTSKISLLFKLIKHD